MNAERDRAWLAGRLNREDVPRFVWDALVARFYAEGQRKNGVALEELAAYARGLLPYGDVVGAASEMPEYSTGRPNLETPRVSDYERERSQTLACYLAFLVQLKVESDGWLRLRRELGEIVDEPKDQRETLAEKGRELSEDLLGYWAVDEVLRLVLTDYFEPRPPVEVEVDAPVGEHLSYGTITLKVEPWVPTETVVRFYQYHQMAVLGHRPRAVSRRNLAVARFVFERLRRLWSEELERSWSEDVDQVPPPSGVSWSALMKEWNEKNPEGAYEEQRLFRRDSNRAARAVVRPYGHKEKHVDAGCSK